MYTRKPDEGAREEPPFYFAQAWIGTPKEEDGRNSMGKQARGPNLAVDYKEQALQDLKFVFTANTFLVSYMPKKAKNVVLMIMLHRDGRICGQDDQKQGNRMYYNATKGGVENMDKLVTG